MPQGSWQIAARPKPQVLAQAWQPWPIRIGGVLVSLCLAWLTVYLGRVMRSRAMTESTPNG